MSAAIAVTINKYCIVFFSVIVPVIVVKADRAALM
jgi:hypothetical protein